MLPSLKDLPSATEVTSDVLSHHIWGPRRKSWGIEMTIVTSLIRGAERHSALVDIVSCRTTNITAARIALLMGSRD